MSMLTRMFGRDSAKSDPRRDTRTEREIIDEIEGLHEEAQEYRQAGDNGTSLESEWESAGHFFIGNHWMEAQRVNALSEGFRVYHFQDDRGLMGVKRCVLNRTGTAVISNVAGQTQEQTVIRLEATESNDRGNSWLTREGGQSLYEIYQQPLDMLAQMENQGVAAGGEAGDLMAVRQSQVDAAQAREAHMAKFHGLAFRPEQMIGVFGPSEPLDEKQAGVVRELIQLGQLKREDLIKVNDATRTEVAQQLLDNLLDRADHELIYTMNEFHCNIWGHQPRRFQWHTSGRHKHSFTLHNDHILNVWIDPTASRIEDAEYLIYDYLMSAKQAKATWPHLADDIDKAASDGHQTDHRFRRGSVWSRTDFRRQMLTVRCSWRRHERVPMSVQQALDEELVTREPVLTDMESGVQEIGEDGRPVWRYFLTGSEQEIEPQDEIDHGTQWPDTIGLRQTLFLPEIHRIIEDVRCPYWDIPFSWNINIPRPAGPYGMGEPIRSESVQRMINTILSILNGHLGFYQFPQRYWPADVLERLRSGGFQLHSRPGAEVPLPRQDWERIMASGGFNAMTQEIPPVPEGYIMLLEKLLNEHDRISGNVDVRQGKPPSKDMSGTAIDSLRAEAYGPLSFRSKFSEWAIQRDAKLALHAIVHFMPESEILKICSRYELPVLREIIRGIDPAQYNVVVETATGKGINRRMDEERALAMYDKGAPGRLLDRRTAMERIRVDDPEAVERRILEEDQKKAAAAAGMPVDGAVGAAPMPMPGQPMQQPAASVSAA